MTERPLAGFAVALAVAAQSFGTPTVTSVSPTEGRVGTTVNVAGNNFGLEPGSTVVWIGSKPGVVESWSDTLIVARVATGAMSGVVQVRHGTVVSNSVRFTVAGPTITRLNQSSDGTQVTVTGYGFGARQGGGQLWLGTANGTVISWTETQIVATVAPGSDSGHVQVIQDGQIGNSVPFTVVGGPPHVLSIAPATAAPGTIVTISGTAFGARQGTGLVTVSGDIASIRSWSDTAIAIVVPPSALTGVIKVQQNGKWSNAATFRSAGNGAATVTLNPHVLGLVVGQSRSLQALDARGGAVHGLSWRSSDPNIVSLSSDDPPMLKALAPGHVTVTAGGASCDITVYGRQ